jgi:hypothetical protein
MKERMIASLWWSMRVYVLLFAGFIAAFGAFRWRLPAYRRRYHQVGRGDAPQRDDPSATGPGYRPNAPLPTTHTVRPWGIAIGLIVVIAAIWVLIAIFA